MLPDGSEKIASFGDVAHRQFDVRVGWPGEVAVGEISLDQLALKTRLTFPSCKRLAEEDAVGVAA
jgi:hypothetical protein